MNGMIWFFILCLLCVPLICEVVQLVSSCFYGGNRMKPVELLRVERYDQLEYYFRYAESRRKWKQGAPVLVVSHSMRLDERELLFRLREEFPAVEIWWMESILTHLRDELGLQG